MKRFGVPSRVVICALLSAVSAGAELTAGTQDIKPTDFNNAASLRGLPGVHLMVAPPLSTELAKLPTDTAALLRREALESLASGRLKEIGVKLFDNQSDEFRQGLAPMLYLRVDVKSMDSVVASSFVLELLQRVNLVRERSVFITAPTWQSGFGYNHFAMSSIDGLATMVRVGIESSFNEFASELSKQNSR